MGKTPWIALAAFGALGLTLWFFAGSEVGRDLLGMGPPPPPPAPPPPPIPIRVVDPSGAPIENACIESHFDFDVYTDAEGWASAPPTPNRPESQGRTVFRYGYAPLRIDEEALLPYTEFVLQPLPERARLLVRLLDAADGSWVRDIALMYEPGLAAAPDDKGWLVVPIFGGELTLFLGAEDHAFVESSDPRYRLVDPPRVLPLDFKDGEERRVDFRIHRLATVQPRAAAPDGSAVVPSDVVLVPTFSPDVAATPAYHRNQQQRITHPTHVPLAPGPYRAWFFHPQFAPAATPLVVPMSGGVIAVDGAFPKSRTIDLTIVDSETGAPIEDALVIGAPTDFADSVYLHLRFVRDWGREGLHRARTGRYRAQHRAEIGDTAARHGLAVTGPDGSARIPVPDAPGAVFTVLAWGRGHLQASVPEGDRATIRWKQQLSATGKLRGPVSRNPESPDYVMVFPASPNAFEGYPVPADPDGRFELWNLPPGTWRVRHDRVDGSVVIPDDPSSPPGVVEWEEKR